MRRKRSGMFVLAMAGTLMAGACDDNDDVLAVPDAQDFEVTVENVGVVYDFASSGYFSTPAGGAAAGPAFPGDVYEFAFSAAPGGRLSFATMFAQSNDWFLGPDGDGIALWNADGSQVTGDVTAQIRLWDAGTEADQEPGLGPNQAPRQSAPDVGPADPDPTVRPAPDTWGNQPPVSAVIRVSLRSTGPTSWVASLRNVSDGSTLATSDGATHPVPLSPGAWVVHTAPDPLFTVGQPDRGMGLEGIAEDGAGAALAAELAPRAGVTGPIAPGAWAVHRTASPLFSGGAVDRGQGLEALAEDGDPADLAASLGGSTTVLSSGAFTTPDGASAAAPAFPGQSYTFAVTAEPGDRLSLATMLVQTNDLFFAPAETGLDLFPGGAPLSADVTGMLLLWDAGTEVNERPGVGLNQAPRQPGPDAGADEGGVVRPVNDGFVYGAVGDLIRVTIRPVG